ncbi:MAG: hypothetical protein M0Z59_09225 [Nitrospiraceae bacterium]|nr:hypothetical protein [Nitrospiraceae bacterium]
MPHFGLMDEDALGPIEGPLLRAKLHIRGGRRRLERGLYTDGIMALFDALCSAMQWYAALHWDRLRIEKGDDPNNDRTLYHVLVRSGVLSGRFSYEEFDALVIRALNEEIRNFDWKGLYEGLTEVFTELGVMPFDEKTLPGEKPEPFLGKP